MRILSNKLSLQLLLWFLPKMLYFQLSLTNVYSKSSNRFLTKSFTCSSISNINCCFLPNKFSPSIISSVTKGYSWVTWLITFYPVANDRAVKAFFLSRVGIVKDNIDFPIADFCFEFRQKPHFCLKSQYLLVFVAYKQVNVPAFFPIVGSRTK